MSHKLGGALPDKRGPVIRPPVNKAAMIQKLSADECRVKVEADAA